ncbi:MAG: TrkA family potassium uptake protein [Hadesarchaea archaeon]|nr:TrkA family potassium uptake protein [Hadesarchaea archaeon]
MKKANYVIIAGGGRVGSHLAKILEPSGRDIVVIEKDLQVCEKLSSEINVLVICGDASDKKTLEEAKIQMADVFAAVTGNDNENIVASQLAKYSYKVPLVLARVDDMNRAQMLRGMGIDLIVSPAHVASMVFENAIALPGTTSILISETITRAVEISVLEDSKAIGKKIRDLPLPLECVIAAIHHGGKLVIPHGNTVIEPDDIVAIIGKEDAIRKVVDIFKG